MKFILIISAVFALSAPVAAQNSASGFQKCGIKAAKASKWDEALECFEQAYRLSKREILLLNIGASQTELGLFVEANASYQKYLRVASDGEFRETAKNAIKTLAPRFGYLDFDYERAPDEVTLDGDIIEPDRMAVNPGTHDIESRWGTKRQQQEITLKEGEEKMANLVLPISPRQAALDNVDLNEKDPEPLAKPKKSKAGLAIGITIGILAVAGAIVAILFLSKEGPLDTNGGVIEVN